MGWQDFKKIDDNKFIYEFVPDAIFELDGYISLGDDEYEVIWTPGHSFDHLCFYNKEKTS